MNYRTRVIIGLCVISGLSLLTAMQLERRGILGHNTSMVLGVIVGVILMSVLATMRGGKK